MNEQKIIVYHHLGLGDHIICNGIVRHFSEKSSIDLLCKKQNLTNIKLMYSDNPDINVMEVSDDNEARVLCDRSQCLRIGFCTGALFYSDKVWDEMFYTHANLPFEYSWSKFFYPRNNQKENEAFNRLAPFDKEYAFVHSTGSDNVDCIDYSAINPKLTIIESNRDIDLFSHRKIIEEAKEIHCINSSFIHLIDRINLKGQLFYHKNFKLKPFSDFTLKHNWNII
jgi:hypothetical protein